MGRICRTRGGCENIYKIEFRGSKETYRLGNLAYTPKYKATPYFLRIKLKCKEFFDISECNISISSNDVKQKYAKITLRNNIFVM